MANIVDVILVKELRERTGIGIMDCKKALVEAQGDIELAIVKMRHYGQVKAVKKAGRMTAEGIILITISQNRECGVIIEINCETDFVAKDTCFKMFGKEVVSTALDRHILNLDVLRAEFEKQRSALIAKTGENIQISRLGVLEGGSLVSYLHYTRIGVIVSATTGANEKLMKHVAMHIAASKPEYINEDDAPVDILERERQIQLAIARKSSKTPEVAEKMVAGRMQQFTDKIFLTDQHFIIDPSKTVGQVLKEHNTNINRFIRFEVGDGIDKT